ncbi:uncharacterized protein LOC101740274 [Bombyx mori]|uniref:Uncharacterized protein n=1 Tax=Bombyx mori TaxID=7091 RepID=A0A8R2HMF3_BOMMO|nr:uncharacterized protein LOC101740274 [Bombyx mori]
MNHQLDRYPSAWAHIVLCADLTWAKEPPDDFNVANQRLWSQHCRVSQVLQDNIESQNSQSSTCESSDGKRTTSNQTGQENGNPKIQKNVKDVIPESRLAQFYGNFYYDEDREKCYTNPNERLNPRTYNGNGCENSDLTECWMLPEVEYWFRRLIEETDRSVSRRRRNYRMPPDEDFERWGPTGVRNADEEALASKIKSVRSLWMPHNRSSPRSPSPPQVSRKIRARRRQPRRLTTLASPPQSFCRDIPAHLLCDPSYKFQFDTPRPQGIESQRAMSRLTASVQAAIRTSTSRGLSYRGANFNRYTPMGQRSSRCPDRRYTIFWPKDHVSPRLHLAQTSHNNKAKKNPRKTDKRESENDFKDIKEDISETKDNSQLEATSTSQQKDIITDDQMPSTSAAVNQAGLKKKRLYSTVLSTSAPSPITLSPVVRLAQKLVTPGILKLNPKIILPSARVRQPQLEHKFEELEKEALEQYKASDESIDTKFQELEKQAVEQYSTSASNTSCSSGNSAEKQTNAEKETKGKTAKFHKPIESIVVYSQNFPDLCTRSTSITKLKNFHNPPRGDKKEHRSKSSRPKTDSQRAASDTDYEAREMNSKNHKSSMRWSLHAVPPKKRHLTFCVSDFSSDDELDDTCSIKDAGPRIKSHLGKIKISAHGGGDLHPILRKI